MRYRRYVFVAACLLFLAPVVQAQDFGVMESAETIDQGNFKFRVNPILVFGDGDRTPGVGVAAGYGITDSVDVEGKLAVYDGFSVFGGDAEFWLVKNPHPVDVSVRAGFHFTNSEFSDQTGVDLAVIGSHAVTPKLDLYGALDMSFNRYSDDLPDRSYTQAHLVPGLEYKLHEDLDLVAEFGIALNNNGNHYVSGGVAYYFR